MSGFRCSDCGARTPIFGQHGARNAANELGIDFLGALPLYQAIQEASDAGLPLAHMPTHVARGFAQSNLQPQPIDQTELRQMCAAIESAAMAMDWGEATVLARTLATHLQASQNPNNAEVASQIHACYLKIGQQVRNKLDL